MLELTRSKLLSKKPLRYLLFGGGCLLALLLIAYLYQAVLLPFALAALLYFLLSSPVDYLSQYRVPRNLVIITIICVVLLVIVFVSIYFLPILYSQMFNVLQSIPNALLRIRAHWIPVLKEHILALDFIDAAQLNVWLDELNIIPQVTAGIRQTLKGIWMSTPGLFNTVVNIVLVPVIAFFLLSEKGSLRQKVKNVIPRDLLPHINTALVNISSTLRSVLKGQAIVAAILALLYIIGLSLVGLKAALVIGLVAGICRIVPYFDLIVGGLLSALVIISDFSGWGQVLGVVGVFVAVQAIDGALITPRIMGNKAGLHPLLVILSVLSFGQLFGFWGVLFAIPVIAVVRVIITQIIPLYQKSKLYDPD